MSTISLKGVKNSVEVLRTQRKGDVIVRTISLSPLLKPIKPVKSEKVTLKRVVKPKDIKPSMDSIAAHIMQRIWFNKELKVNLTPKEYDQKNKLVIFEACTPDGKTKYKFTSHVLDLQARIEKESLLLIAMVG